jgi:hypothetical protein
MATARFGAGAFLGTLSLVRVVAAALLVLAPWTYRNYHIHGRFTPVAVAGTDMAPVTAREIAKDGLTVSILKKTWKDPASVAGRTIQHFVQFWELTHRRLATDSPKLRSTLHQNDTRLPSRYWCHRGPGIW